MIDDDLNNEEEVESGPDFNYILGMPLWCLSRERKDDLVQKKEGKAKELSELRRKSPRDLWKADLEGFLLELDVSNGSDDRIYYIIGDIVQANIPGCFYLLASS